MPLKSKYQDRLRKAYNAIAVAERWKNTRRAVRLPSSLDVRMSTGRGGLALSLSADAVLANMQTDAAAFEGWALALRLWCDEPSITLDWEVPDAGSGHYQRFLYRVDRFRSLFPGWFFIADDSKLAASHVCK